MQSIKEQIKNGKLEKLQLIYGEERYMVRYYKNQIIKALGMEEDEMNCSNYDGDGIDISAMMDVAQTLPFFAEKRLLIIENSGFFKSANELADFLPDIPDTTYLLFVEKEVDKRNRVYKYFQKNGCVTEAKQENENQLVNWVAAYFKSAGKSITKNAVMLLLHKVGANMELLTTEMEKVIAYAYERDFVEETDIEAVCVNQLTGKIFEMVDAVSDRNKKRALLLYHDLLALREPSARILYLLVRHVNQMLQVKELEAKRTPSGDIASKVGIPPFAVRKISAQSKQFSRKQLLGMLVQGTKYEEAIKTGNLNERLAVEMFLVRYT